MSGATQYRVQVYKAADSSIVYVDAWYQSSAVCAGATCSVTPPTGLGAMKSSYVWRAQSKIGSGTASAWSATMSFNAAPATWDGLSCKPPKVFAAGDFNGDGRTDRVCWDASIFNVSLATASGFAPPVPWLYSDLSLAYPADVDLDGRSDLVHFDAWLGRFYVSKPTGTGFSVPELWGTAYREISGIPYQCRIAPINGGVGDFDGDGLPDVFCKEGDAPNIFIGLQRTSVSTGQQVFDFTTFTLGGWTCDATGQRIGVADLNGDGKDDWYCIGLNTGIFTAKLSNGANFVNASFTSFGPFCALNKWTLADVNGDGKADVYCPTNANVALNTGRSFIHQGTSGTANAQTVDVFGADVDGDGVNEIVINTINAGATDIQVRKWVWDGTKMALNIATWKASWCSEKVFSGDFNGDGKADLLCEANQAAVVAGTAGVMPDQMIAVTNGLGGTTQVVYAASPTFPEAHISSAFPEANNAGVRHLVKTLKILDGKGGISTTDFAYKGGKMDRKERQFLGYRYVRSNSPCLVPDANGDCPAGADRPYSETLFSQEIASAGSPLTAEFRDGPGQLLSSSNSTYTTTTTIPRRSVLSSAQQTTYSGSNSKQTGSTYQYDSYGNVTQMVFQGEVGTGGDELQADSSYLPNTTAYVVNRLAKVERRQPGGSLLAAQEFLYDGATAYTQAPVKGNLTKVRAWLNPGSRWVSKTITYDTWWNANGGTDETNRSLPTIVFGGTHHLFPDSATNAAGESSSTTWDIACGVPTQTTDANGQTTTFQYDVLCRPTRTDDPSGGYQVRSYASLGNPALQNIRVASNPPTGVTGDDWAESYFDGLGRGYRGRKRGPSSSQTIVTEQSFGPRGVVTKTSAPFYEGAAPPETTYEYDALNRPTKATHPDGNYVDTTYGLWTQTASDENHRPSTVTFDAYGRTVRSERTLNGQPVETESSYDPLGRLTSMTDAIQNSWSWTFDTLGRNLSRNDPDAGVWSYAYDDAGRLTQQTDAKVQVTTLSYDTVGRQSGKVSPVGTTTLTYSEARAGFYNVGRPTTVTSPGTVLKMDYDKLGRAVKTTRTLDAVDYVFQKRYDSSGRATGITYPDGDQVGPVGNPILYDEAGRLRLVPGIVNDVGYDAAGRPVQRTNANGTQTTWGYTPDRGFLDTIYTSGPAVVQNLDYDVDPVGMVTQITSPVTNEAWSYIYDDLYRVTTATNLTTPANSQTWAYDEIGRITSNSRVGTYTYPLPGQSRPHAPSSVNGSPYTYDGNGNLSAGGGRTPAWDGENRISQIGTTQFTYDDAGERLKKTAAGVTSRYPMGDDYEITNGTVTKYVSIGGLGLVAKRVGPSFTTYWLHPDRLGSIQAITDASGAIVQRRTYRPYGEKIGDSTSHTESRGWIDQRQDGETGLTYLHARYYDPQLGTFLSPDPIGPEGGLNSYGYGGGNPANLADRSGLIPILPDDDPCSGRGLCFGSGVWQFGGGSGFSGSPGSGGGSIFGGGGCKNCGGGHHGNTGGAQRRGDKTADPIDPIVETPETPEPPEPPACQGQACPRFTEEITVEAEVPQPDSMQPAVMAGYSGPPSMPFGSCIERFRFSNIYSLGEPSDAAAAGSAAAHTANAVGNKLVGDTGRMGLGGVPRHPTSWQHKLFPSGGKLAGRATVVLTVFEGFYDLGTIGYCAVQ